MILLLMLCIILLGIQVKPQFDKIPTSPRHRGRRCRGIGPNSTVYHSKKRTSSANLGELTFVERPLETSPTKRRSRETNALENAEKTSIRATKQFDLFLAVVPDSDIEAPEVEILVPDTPLHLQSASTKERKVYRSQRKMKTRIA